MAWPETFHLGLLLIRPRGQWLLGIANKQRKARTSLKFSRNTGKFNLLRRMPKWHQLNIFPPICRRPKLKTENCCILVCPLDCLRNGKLAGKQWNILLFPARTGRIHFRHYSYCWIFNEWVGDAPARTTFFGRFMANVSTAARAKIMKARVITSGGNGNPSYFVYMKLPESVDD